MKKLFLLSLAVLFLLAACFHAKTLAPAPAPAPSPTPIPVVAPTTAPIPTPPPLPPPPKVKKVEAQVLSLDAGNIYFNPKNFTVKVNQPVTVNFTNKGSHTFTIDELGVNARLQDASGSFTFTPTKTGSFTYYCSVPGHRQAGQFGTLTVTE